MLAPRPVSTSLANAAWLAGVFVACCATGVLLVRTPLLAFAPLAVLFATLLVVSPLARTIFVIAGGLLVFQSSDHFTTTKLLYFVGVIIAGASAFWQLRSTHGSRIAQLLTPTLVLSVWLLCMLAISLPVSLVHGTPVSSWARDIAAYALFAVAPLFALDLRARVATGTIVRILVAAGSFGAASFLVAWSARHGVATLPITHLALPTFLLPAALFAYCLGCAFNGRGRPALWLAGAGGLVIVIGLTGTRTAFVLLLAPLGMIVVRGGNRLGRAFRASGIAVGVGATAALVAGMLMLLAPGVADRAAARFFLTGTLVSHRANDLSYRDRTAQSAVTVRAFLGSPVVGVGPGHVFSWIGPQGDPRRSAAVDAAMSFPAKFGLVGVILLVGGFASLFRTIRRVTRAAAPSSAILALGGFCAVTLGVAILGSPFEDKGLSFAFLLLLALSLPSASLQAALEGAPAHSADDALDWALARENSGDMAES